jgi:hypothetical protein
VDTDSDRFVDVSDAIAAVTADEDFPQGPVERIEVRCHGSGEVTWRAWTPRAEDAVGGYFTSEHFA